MARYYLHLGDDPDAARREVNRRKLDATVAGLWRLFFFIAAVLLLGGLLELLGPA
jgi:hypothetical protein